MANELSFSERAGNAWGSFKAEANGFVESQNFDKLLIALTVLGAIGAAAASVGVASFAAQAGAPVVDPTGMLNSLGNSAIAFMAAGGALSVLGMVCVTILMKRMKERQTVNEAIKASNDNRERARQASRDFLQYTREEAKTLKPNEFRVFDVSYLGYKPKDQGLFSTKTNYFVILSSTEDKFSEEIVAESALQAKVAVYKQDYRLVA